MDLNSHALWAINVLDGIYVTLRLSLRYEKIPVKISVLTPFSFFYTYLRLVSVHLHILNKPPGQKHPAGFAIRGGQRSIRCISLPTLVLFD
jgi:hypothetical protein